ncbi:undecaprenyl-phosphomannose:protein mannosyltransferase [Candidatus Rickettsiella viridis]|uniref:Undecaprenyl-phosphomannose:protein mannosyltransferase n=1 Tax=Candidatus Rickettsiella viridis TaxID=676208 RepID=A0A2Z5UWX2_9COXI|nr:glycosyltransferase family 39 protein [Candidatus Rickettsiella viridis]BBB15615.1 undecaprenyl-phosphomannose:protein mannosyltransferase [Candidatus Rickettsiella viridis]
MFLQLLLWSLLPVFIRHSTTHDIIEALTWGRQFEWGYEKNPFLVGILAHLGGLFGNNGFGIYLIQQLFILLGVWSTKQLTFELSHNRNYAFISATALLLYFFYNFEVQLNNDNYILQGLLPFSALCFYRGIKNNDLKQWFFSAASLALATLAKYSAVLFLPLYVLYLLFSKQGKKYLFSSKPYLAFLLYGLMLLPHLIWLNHQSFHPLHYAFLERGKLQQLTHLEYLFYNSSSLLSIFLEMLPGLLAILFAIEYKTGSTAKLLDSDGRFFSCLIGLGPIILLFILASVLGFLIRTEWFMPFLSFLGTVFFVIFQPSISKRSITRYIVFLITLMLTTGFIYIIISKKRTAIYYPGPEIANVATQLWHAQYKTKLAYVAGSRYTAGYIAFYSPDKPQVWVDWDNKKSPWVDLNTLHCKGGLFVLESSNDKAHKKNDFSPIIRQQFPMLLDVPVQYFQWHRNPTNKPPLEVRFALLAPNKAYCHSINY